MHLVYVRVAQAGGEHKQGGETVSGEARAEAVEAEVDGGNSRPN
jgi:hypothetical protein